MKVATYVVLGLALAGIGLCIVAAIQSPPEPELPPVEDGVIVVPTKTPYRNEKPQKSAEARRVLDKAIAAFGGRDARKLLRRGYVKFTVIGMPPAIARKFGANAVTFEAHFDLPEFERRDIYAKKDGEHILFITNRDSLWMGDQTGRGIRRPAPPREVYRGPLLIGILQSLIEVRDQAFQLVLKSSFTSKNQSVIEAYLDGQLASRIFVDNATGLPARFEKFVVAPPLGNSKPQLTVTEFSKYKRFGSANLPTIATATQHGKEVLSVRLISADFDSPVAAKHFDIPE